MLAFIPYKSNEFKEFSKNERDNRPYKYIFEDHDEISDSEEEVDVNEPSEKSSDNQGDLFYLKEQIEVPLRNLVYSDLYVLGFLKTVLIGASFRLLPVVNAARPPPPPERPPKMTYKELPIYQSPHYEYKEYINDKGKCPLANTKLLHQYLLSYVKKCRINAECQICKYICKANDIYRDIYCCKECTKQDVKIYMRDPNNLTIRRGLVAGGISTGFIMGPSIPRRLFYSGLGGLATGALCFPKETDESFRTFLYHSAQMFISMYNLYCTRNYSMRDKVPCTKDLPPEPPKRETCKCPKK